VNAKTDHPVNSLIASRWSPYAFTNRLVSRADLLSLFEAARWAPSSYNEQPWSFILATRDNPDDFQKMISCLVEANQTWAQHAAALAISVASLNFTRNGRANAAALHDIGLAVANLTLEATARGISVHQMIGILPDRACDVYGIPEGQRPLTAFAIGYAGSPASLSEEMRVRDQERRGRKPLSEFLYEGSWEKRAKILD
jgi:nitroreductase